LHEYFKVGNLRNLNAARVTCNGFTSDFRHTKFDNLEVAQVGAVENNFAAVQVGKSNFQIFSYF